jgi:hypothetical protein
VPLRFKKEGRREQIGVENMWTKKEKLMEN